jgi:primosomal protein N' (replication factor Y)
MFQSGDIVKVLVPIGVSDGYDYRLMDFADIGGLVKVSVMNRPLVGVVVGAGESNLAPEKIKPATPINFQISNLTLRWIYKMSDWTMMPIGMVLRLILNVPEAFAPPKTEQLYTFSAPEKMRMTEQRQAVADAFASNDNEPMTASDIQNIARVSGAVVRTMIDKGILQKSGIRNCESDCKNINYFDTKSVVLNAEQQAAADAINLEKFSVFLLDGITGSGKTQVYFDAAWRMYSAGKSVLIMMPEIALTAQFMDRFTKRFGAPPVVWHSNLTAAKRRDIWRGVASGDIRMVIGTRSALFLPWQNLGLIVVDEEHDGSYKQEDMGNYHARDMAILRGATQGFPIILASATPSAETLHNAEIGKYTHLKLVSRFGGATLPTIETIDVRKETFAGGHISPTLSAAIRETLDAGQQSMLFINRRGYAPIVQCKKCGWHADCPDCSAGMSHHKKNNSLLCHICGRTRPMPTNCPDCGGTELSMSGVGLEKIAEEVREKFPGARIALVSSDTMMLRQALERLVAQMESGDIDIVIGTQILAKGHHFPNLTLVGVIDADMGLFGADFRAGEKTFQQLFQVAGRAGRGDKPGRVMLQTFQPEHPVLRAICAENRDAFMANDMTGRRAAKMPPFGQLVAVIIEAEKESVLQKFCADLATAAPKLVNQQSAISNQQSLKILGPIPAQIYKIRTWYRMRFLVTGDERAALQPAVKHWLGKVKTPANVRVKIDVQPVNFI